MRTLTALAALVLCAGAFSNETTIEVPQGSGVFPTVGQLNCLEEAGSGRFCAATYECADESGDLWGDLANHDGRRAIGVDSPVARERDCTITVDGKAAVRWFVGFSPDGRNGELVGLTAKHDAEPPVMRRVAQGGSGGSGSFLSWFMERFEIEDLAAEVREATCGHYKEGHEYHERCLENTLPNRMGMTVQAMTWENTPFMRCTAELRAETVANHNRQYNREPENPLEALLATGGYSGTCQAVPPNYGLVTNNLCVWVNTLGSQPDRSGGWLPPGRYAECRRLLEEQWEREGFGELQ